MAGGNTTKVHGDRLSHYQMTLMGIAEKIDLPLEDFLSYTTKVVAQTLVVDRVSVWFHTPDQSEIVCDDLYSISKNTHEKGRGERKSF